MGLGTQFGPAEALAVVDRALGITLIDTAELYGHGDSERLLGRALADPAARDAVVLASKVTPTWPTRDRVAAARGSLARLGTDRLDLYQVHWPNPLVAQRSTMAVMRTLRAGGLIRQVGVSNYGQGCWPARYTAATAAGGARAGNLLFSTQNLRRAEPVLQALRELARAHPATPAQVALAWSSTTPTWSPSPGPGRSPRWRRTRPPPSWPWPPTSWPT
jgi:aryl-alcohol dehydrogenase-like predicted oxidoreductase